MTEKFKNRLTKFSQKGISIIKKYLDISKIRFDHVCYQTTSKTDYNKAILDLAKDVEIVGEIPHAGRMLTIVKLKQPIKIDNVLIDTLEIAEPKPKKAVEKRNFDHISFYIDQGFEETIEELKKKSIRINEIKQIGGHKFFKCCEKKHGISVEIRNKSLQEAVSKYPQKARKTPKTKPTTKPENLKKQLATEREKKLRALADYQNLQKRLETEKKQIETLRNGTVLSQIVDVLDDLDRTIENLNIAEKDQVGIRMIRDKIQQIIDSQGIVEIFLKVGDKMNPNLCEAIGIVAANKGEAENIVKQIVQKGYIMKDSEQVIRPARVIVSKKS